MPQHWLYPVNPESSYYIIDPDTGEELPVSAENLWDDIPRRGDELDDWFLSTGYKSMKPGDFVWVYEAGRHRAVVALGHAQRIYEDEAGWHVDLLWDQASTKLLRRQPIPGATLRQRIQSQVRANAQAQAVLDQWLKFHQVPVPSANSQSEPISDEDARLKVLAEIHRRRGQRTFRQALMDAYDGRCAVTGCIAEEVLEAAHIKPYRGEHTNVVRNGLLLRSDVHTLFDLRLIGIDKNGKVVVSPRLAGTEYAAFQSRKAKLPKAKADQPMASLLAAHLKELKKQA